MRRMEDDMHCRNIRRSVAPLALLAVIAGLGGVMVSRTTQAQDVAAMINKALDQPVQLTFQDNTTVPQALEAISTQTGVRIKADPVIYELLPWGRDTAVRANIQNAPLREALEIITRTLGLTMALRPEFVEITPMPALRRLAQRANRDELDCLSLLASRPLNLATDRPTVAQLLESVDEKLENEKPSRFAVENRITEAVKQDRMVYVPRNATLMEALESLHKDTKATWYPWGNNVLVVTKEEATRRMLSKPLTIRPGERGMDILQVFTDISARTGVFFEYQPGVIQAVPTESRTVRGYLENVPALQALEAVSAGSGLKYAVADDRVVISMPPPIAGAAPPRDRSVGFIQLENGLNVMIPSSEVPDDVKQYIRFKTRQEVEKLREMMIKEGFRPEAGPATQPATRPAGEAVG
jgi:hypothetical protein